MGYKRYQIVEFYRAFLSFLSCWTRGRTNFCDILKCLNIMLHVKLQPIQHGDIDASVVNHDKPYVLVGRDGVVGDEKKSWWWRGGVGTSIWILFCFFQLIGTPPDHHESKNVHHESQFSTLSINSTSYQYWGVFALLFHVKTYMPDHLAHKSFFIRQYPLYCELYHTMDTARGMSVL